MADVMYLADRACTCRQIANDAADAETASNLYELAKVYDRQIAATKRVGRQPHAQPHRRSMSRA